ncbi:MAG: hypothetical protein ABIO70_19140 [Pseudomonadota bacterium]
MSIGNLIALTSSTWWGSLLGLLCAAFLCLTIVRGTERDISFNTWAIIASVIALVLGLVAVFVPAAVARELLWCEFSLVLAPGLAQPIVRRLASGEVTHRFFPVHLSRLDNPAALPPGHGDLTHLLFPAYGALFVLHLLLSLCQGFLGGFGALAGEHWFAISILTLPLVRATGATLDRVLGRHNRDTFFYFQRDGWRDHEPRKGRLLAVTISAAVAIPLLIDLAAFSVGLEHAAGLALGVADLLVLAVGASLLVSPAWRPNPRS